MVDRKYMSKTFLHWATITLCVGILALVGCKGVQDGGTQQVQIKGETFTLELAMTQSSQFQGLSGRESIPVNGGMLFVFPSEKERTFVMRDCLVPIDILFLNPRGEVMSAYAMKVEPAGLSDSELVHYSSNGKTAFVIELAGGTNERLGIEVGDVIELPMQELKRRAG